MVGRIESVERRPYGLFQRAEVEPAVNFRQLEEVFVILDQRELPPDEAFESDDDGLWLESDAREVPAAPADAP